MLNTIQLTNFQRHRDLTVDFGPGLTAVKALNEGGKSTLLRAIAYALFGTKALPDSLDDTVTWGEPVNSLQVVLDFTVNGVQYKLRRSKGAAELRYGDESVTGQTETAKFIADLLGADAAMASNLIIAGQNEVRGALSGGAKGAVQLIEKLADFAQLDELIDLLQSSLVTGNTATAKAALEQAQAVLEETPEPEPIDKNGLLDEVTELGAHAADAKIAAEKAQQAAKDAEAARDKGLAAAQRRRDLEVKIEDRSGAQVRLIAEKPIVMPWTDVDAGALAAEERGVMELQAAIARREANAKGGRLNEETSARWGRPEGDHQRYEGSVEELSDEISKAAASLSGLGDKANKCEREAAAKRARIVVNSCSLCGRDVKDIPEVAAANAALEEEAHQLDLLAQDARERAAELQSWVEAAQQLREAHKLLVAGAPEGWRVTNDLTPGVLQWDGPPDEPDAERKLTDAQQRVAELRQKKASAEETERARKAHQQRVDRAAEELQALQDELAALPSGVDLDSLREAVSAAGKVRDEASATYTQALQAHAARSAEVTAAISAYDQAIAARERAAAEVTKRTEELKGLEFNNTLLKAVREARPIVANKLWALVLGAVSEYFSAMRGEPSEVTRGPDGFMVDGHPVSTLSGSTKDILGLAIRIALTRTFLPGISLLLLDEPNAAMDDERTANVLGFLGGAGFDQIVVVSHDEMTVDVADHIVTLE